MRIVFIGPPGAGKGTQSARLAKHLGLPHLSTGDILRKAIRDGTDLGLQVGPIMRQGKLVSDELMLGVVSERLDQEDCDNGYLLDGFPRTVPQAIAFDQLLADRGTAIDHVIELRVPDEELRSRLESRFRELESPRPDDRPEAIPKRLNVYHTETSPLLNFYTGHGQVLKTIDGTGTMDTVFQRIVAAVS